MWIPDLPGADEPDINQYNLYIEKNCPFSIDNETMIVGHSSGAVAALGLIQTLKGGVKAGKAILVAGFTNDLNYDPVKKMFRTWKFDFEKIKKHVETVIAVYSDDDPYVPVSNALDLERLVGAKLYLLPGQKHFSTSSSPKYTQFQALIDIIFPLA